MRAGLIEKTQTPVSGREKIRDKGGGVLGIRTPFFHGITLQIPGEGANGGGLQLVSGDFESKESGESVDANVADTGV